MRTTVDLPDEVFRRAKIVAVERGTTLRELVRQALSREIGLDVSTSEIQKRTEFPIFGSKSPGTLDLKNEDLSRLESEEDARRHGLSG
jgi:hypothetical protein